MSAVDTKPRTVKAARSWGKAGYVALATGALGKSHAELLVGSLIYLEDLGERFGEEYHRAGGSWVPKDFRDFCCRRLRELYPLGAPSTPSGVTDHLEAEEGLQ